MTPEHPASEVRASDDGAPDVPGLAGLRGGVAKNRRALTVAGVLVIAGGVAGVLKALGLRIASTETLPPATAGPLTVQGSEEGPPPPKKTSERVAALQVAVEALQGQAKATTDEVVALKVQQATLGVRMDGVKDEIQQLRQDQRLGVDRLMNRLDDLGRHR